MEVLGTMFDQLVVSFQHLGIHAYWLLMVIAFLDSVIVTGTFMNGTIFLLVAGVMVSRGTHDFAQMALFASAGAILGGMFSYYLGTMGSSLWHRGKKVVHERHVGMGSELLKRYGGPGIFVGRFFGPVSSIVAFVAGTLSISKRKFHLWNALAGLCWGVGYVTIGLQLGESLHALNIL